MVQGYIDQSSHQKDLAATAVSVPHKRTREVEERTTAIAFSSNVAVSPVSEENKVAKTKENGSPSSMMQLNFYFNSDGNLTFK